jgi:membrane protease YdiL (CAAX protease family)
LSSTDNPHLEPQPHPVIVDPVIVDPMIVDPVIVDPLSATVDPFVSTNLLPDQPSPPVVKDPVWSGWDVLLIALLTFVTLVVVQFGAAVGAWRLMFPHESFGDVVQKPVLTILSQFLAYVAVAAYMIMLVQGKYHQPFWQAIRWNWPRNVVLMLLLGMFTVSLDLLSRYLPMPKTTPFDQFFARPSDAYLMVVFAVTFGPLMEELFFRGFLYPILARWTGATVAVVLTALPFGLIHYVQYKSWAAVLVIALVGVVLTTVRAVTKSVAASFLVHVGYNGTLMALAALATDGFRHMEKAAVLRF